MSKTAHNTKNDPRYARVGEAIDTARERAKMTRAVLAERLHVPPSAVTYMIAGERRVDVVELCEIASVTGADPVELFRAAIGEQSDAEELLMAS